MKHTKNEMTKLHCTTHLAHDHSKTEHTYTHTSSVQLHLAVVCVPGEREYERCRFSRISVRQGWRQLTYDRGCRSHEVGAVLTVKFVIESCDRNEPQWYVHGMYASLPIQCVVFAVPLSQHFEMHYLVYVFV